MDIFRWLLKERSFAIIVSLVLTVLAIVTTLRTGEFTDRGWLHTNVIGGIVAAIFCIGLCFRQAWSRWVGFAYLAGGGTLLLWRSYLNGVSVNTILFILGCPYIFWRLWKLQITRVQELLNDDAFMSQLRVNMAQISDRLDGRENWKIVIFFREPLALDAKRLSQCAQRAFGHHFEIIDRAIDPVDASFLPSEQSVPHSVVAGHGPVFICYDPPHLFGVYAFPATYQAGYDDEPGSEPDNQNFPEHQGCIQVEHLPYVGNMEAVENGFAFSGKLAAELSTEDCVGIYLPNRRRFFPMSPQLRDSLRTADPLGTLDN